MIGYRIWIACSVGIILSTALGAILVLRRQSHRPLGWALLIAAVSLAASGAILGRYRAEPPTVWLATHIAASLCLGWMLVGLLIDRHVSRIGGGHYVVEIIEFVAITSGMVTVALLVHAALIEILFRLFYLAGSDVPSAVFPFGSVTFRHSVSPRIALLDVAAVAAATGVGIRLKRQPALLTLLFWLGILGCVWVGLLVEPVPLSRPPGLWHASVDVLEWPLAIIVCAAAVLLLFVWAQQAADATARRRAWPDALHELLAPAPVWPGFATSAALVASAVLVVGCLMVTRVWTLPAATMAAAAMFLLVHRSWNENLAETAMALTTLAAVSASFIGVHRPDRSPNTYPVLFHRALLGLAVMTWFWPWLAAVWRQQLDRGRPWTTAGRMIPAMQRVGFLVATIAVLVALTLATWPQRIDVTDLDRSPERWFHGLLGITLVFLALVSAAIRSGRPTLGWLSIFALGAIAMFVHFRLRGSETHLWVVRHFPLLLAGAAPLIALLPRVLRMTPQNPYTEVFYVGGTVVAPVGTLTAMLLLCVSDLAGRGVAGAALAALAGWYAILSTFPRLRDLLWIALALANLAAIDFWSQRGTPVMGIAAATAAQVTVSGWLLARVYWGVLRTPARRFLACLISPAAGAIAAILVAVTRRPW